MASKKRIMGAEMNLDEYQGLALRTAGNGEHQWMERALGLAGEAGEVCDLIKKEKFHGKTGAPIVGDLRKELGDVLWYVSTLAATYGLSLSEIAEANISKLKERHPKGFRKRFENE